MQFNPESTPKQIAIPKYPHFYLKTNQTLPPNENENRKCPRRRAVGHSDPQRAVILSTRQLTIC